MKTPIIITGFLILVTTTIFIVNYLMIGKSLAGVLKSDPRNSGIQMTANYGNYVVPSVLVLMVRKVSDETNPLDVFRMLL